MGGSSATNRDGRLEEEWEEVRQQIGMEDWGRMGGSTAANRDGRLGGSTERLK